MIETAWLLDTNVLSIYLRREAPQEYPKLVSWVDGLLRTQAAALAAMTVYELRRGIKSQLLEGKAKRKAARLEMLLRTVRVLGLDARDFAGWKMAADLWADARSRKPAILLEEGDLLIFATALAHGRKFATADARLIERLKDLDHAEAASLIDLA